MKLRFDPARFLSLPLIGILRHAGALDHGGLFPAALWAAGAWDKLAAHIRSHVFAWQTAAPLLPHEYSPSRHCYPPLSDRSTHAPRGLG